MVPALIIVGKVKAEFPVEIREYGPLPPSILNEKKLLLDEQFSPDFMS